MYIKNHLDRQQGILYNAYDDKYIITAEWKYLKD